MNNILLQFIIVSFTVVYSENSCWYTRCQKDIFTIKPDNLPCSNVDVDKISIFKIKKQGIYVCDLCPYFPHKRFVNVSLSNIPSTITSNIKFPECFGHCFDKADCVAFSYDHLKLSCYFFNNTIGTLITRAEYTTIIMTQPVGFIQKWRYTRHTSLTGDILNSVKENNFQICLSKCNENNECNSISYSFKTSNCLMFSSQEQIKYTYLNYGHISAYRITSRPAISDAISRFTAEGDDLYITENVKKDNSNNECSSFQNSPYSAFYSEACLTSGSSDCNSTTGCKSCYYPEKTKISNDLDMCPDSEQSLLNNLKKSVQENARNCLENTNCIGIGFNSDTKEFHQLTFRNFVSNEYTTKFILNYPTIQSVDQELLTTYDFMFNYDIIQISNNAASFQETIGTTLKGCLNLYQSNNNYIRMSYSTNKCKLSSEEVKYVFVSGDFVIAFKKPALTSPLLNYGRTPGFVVPKENAKNTFDQCGKNCEVSCAQKCNIEFKSWCSHFSIEQDENKGTCFFFEILRDSVIDSIQLQQMDQGQIFTKRSSLDFTLESLNKINPFQSNYISNCFLPESEDQETITNFQTSGNQDTGVMLRRKRGFFSFFTSFVKVVECVSDAVSDIAKWVGRFRGWFSRRSFDNSPLIENIKNVVALGKAVVVGDWKTVKNRGIAILESPALSAALSVIPVTAPYSPEIKMGLKVFTSLAQMLRKKQRSLIHISPVKDISEGNDNNNIGSEVNDKNNVGSEVNDNNNVGSEVNDNHNVDSEVNDNNNVGNNLLNSNNMNKNINNEFDGERNQCKKRMKRTTGFSKNIKWPGNCDYDDDGGDIGCLTLNIKKVMFK